MKISEITAAFEACKAYYGDVPFYFYDAQRDEYCKFGSPIGRAVGVKLITLGQAEREALEATNASYRTP